jgi:hypothetical protein
MPSDGVTAMGVIMSELPNGLVLEPCEPPEPVAVAPLPARGPRLGSRAVSSSAPPHA